MSMIQDHPGVIAPPPLIYLGGLLLAWLAEKFLPLRALGLAQNIAWSLGAVLVLIGAYLMIAATFRFKQAQTDARPWKPSTAIVMDGPYRFTRNPMYLGMTLAYAGIAIAANSSSALLLLVPVVLTIHFGVILREEAYLAAKFGEDYLALKRKTRRWI